MLIYISPSQTLSYHIIIENRATTHDSCDPRELARANNSSSQKISHDSISSPLNSRKNSIGLDLLHFFNQIKDLIIVVGISKGENRRSLTSCLHKLFNLPFLTIIVKIAAIKKLKKRWTFHLFA